MMIRTYPSKLSINNSLKKASRSMLIVCVWQGGWCVCVGGGGGVGGGDNYHNVI